MDRPDAIAMDDSSMTDAVDAAPAKADGTPDSPARRPWLKYLLMLSVPLLVAAAAVYYWMASQGSVSTDNAYLQQDKVSISAEIGGKIIEIHVKPDQMVQKGDLLFRIDPEPYRLAVAQADAAIRAASVQVETLGAGYQSAAVDIGAAREDIAFAEANFGRQAALMERGFTTKRDYDAARHAVAQARERLRQAQADAGEARARLSTGGPSGSNPQIEAARVQREQALVNLAKTEIRAPASGRIAQSDRLQLGQMMIAGLPALTIVGTDTSWVEANFKETDLADMRVGQPAILRFDAYPGLKVRGHVASIGAGTGSEFSVLPAQNANGNWVKVTQRVPVRIALDEKPARAMIAGLSVEVEVDTRGKPRR